MRRDEPEEADVSPHPAAECWEALIRANEAMDSAQAARSASLYRQAVHVTARRARQYSQAMEALLEELGE
jgi:hypothetical protein